MKINHLITIILIAVASGCPSEKPENNKPVKITFSAALSLQNALKDAEAQFQEN